MAVRYHVLEARDNIRQKVLFIVFAIFVIFMANTFVVLCIKRKYGEYNGPFFQGVCEPWWEDNSDPYIHDSGPNIYAMCGPKKMVYNYVNETYVFSGYIQYCSIANYPTPAPNVYSYEFIN